MRVCCDCTCDGPRVCPREPHANGTRGQDRPRVSYGNGSKPQLPPSEHPNSNKTIGVKTYPPIVFDTRPYPTCSLSIRVRKMCFLFLDCDGIDPIPIGLREAAPRAVACCFAHILTSGYESKFNHQGPAGVGPCFYLPTRIPCWVHIFDPQPSGHFFEASH